MDHGHVAAPAGLRKLYENGARYFGITSYDIVRSSLWVHENRLQNQLRNFGRPFESWKTKNYKYAGTLPGAFTIPICRNPLGEAISSVWTSTVSPRHPSSTYTHDRSPFPWYALTCLQSKNYPCRCGEIDWETKQLTAGLPETKAFYELSMLYASEQFEDYCDSKNNCNENYDYDWTFTIQQGYPPQTKHLKHAWDKCEGRGHKTLGFPKKDK